MNRSEAAQCVLNEQLAYAEKQGQIHHKSIALADLALSSVQQAAISKSVWLPFINGKKAARPPTEIQAGVTQCRQECDYFASCGGGSPVNKLSEHGTFACTETMHCKLKIKTAIDAALAYLDPLDDE